MGMMTLTPGFKCEVGDTLEIGFGREAQRVKITEVQHKDGATTFHWDEVRNLTRSERRGKVKVDEKYYLQYAKR